MAETRVVSVRLPADLLAAVDAARDVRTGEARQVAIRRLIVAGLDATQGDSK